MGVNCLFDPDTTVKTIKAMKTALDAAGLSPYLMTQPNGFHCPGVGKQGYLSCPEFPYGEYHEGELRWGDEVWQGTDKMYHGST